MSLWKFASKNIDFFGEEVLIRPRVETIVGNEREVTLGDQYKEKVMITQITGFAELYERYGILTRADFIMTGKHDSTVGVGDIVWYNSVWYEVAEKLPRKYRGKNVDSIDYVLRRKEG